MFKTYDYCQLLANFRQILAKLHEFLQKMYFYVSVRSKQLYISAKNA